MIKHKTEGAITMATKKDVHDLFLNHVNSNAVKTRKIMTMGNILFIMIVWL